MKKNFTNRNKSLKGFFVKLSVITAFLLVIQNSVSLAQPYVRVEIQNVYDFTGAGVTTTYGDVYIRCYTDDTFTTLVSPSSSFTLNFDEVHFQGQITPSSWLGTYPNTVTISSSETLLFPQTYLDEKDYPYIGDGFGDDGYDYSDLQSEQPLTYNVNGDGHGDTIYIPGDTLYLP